VCDGFYNYYISVSKRVKWVKIELSLLFCSPLYIPDFPNSSQKLFPIPTLKGVGKLGIVVVIGFHFSELEKLGKVSLHLSLIPRFPNFSQFQIGKTIPNSRLGIVFVIYIPVSTFTTTFISKNDLPIV